MYELDVPSRTTPRRIELPTGVDPAQVARLTLARVRKLLAAFIPGMNADPVRLTRSLATPFREPPLERERLLALGWLRWLSGDFTAAVPLLADAERRCLDAAPDEPALTFAELTPLESGVLLARSAYWSARVRLLIDRSDAVADYEAVMRKLGGSPQATAWYVDLLWRAGKVDRAEQVWKSVRTNKRVLSSDDGPLLEVRGHLRRGELGPAEKLLREVTPAGGVAWVERHLLWAWALAGMRQTDRAFEVLQTARQGPYPSTVLDNWQAALAARRDGRSLLSLPLPAGWREFVRGQQERGEKHWPDAESAYRASLAIAAVGPFARYGLVGLGMESASALLPGVQGLFFAIRLRARQAVERVLSREIGPGEFLDAMNQARAAGYQPPGAEHYIRLANHMQKRQATLADLLPMIDTPEQGAIRRNLQRVAFELAARRAAPADALTLMQTLARREEIREDATLGAALGRHLFSLAVTPRNIEALEQSAALLPDEPLVPLARHLLDSAAPEATGEGADLWRIASTSTLTDDARQHLQTIRKQPRWRSLAILLLLQDAAARNDVNSVAALLERPEDWRGFRGKPPRIAVAAIESVASNQPGHPAWIRCLPGWLATWPPSAVEKCAGSLPTLAGHVLQGDAPGGVEPAAWFLHQASRALQQGDARAALTWAERVPDLSSLPEGEIVQSALPALRRLAEAQALAACLPGHPAGEVLTDMADRLRAFPEGERALRAALAGERGAVQAALAELLRRSDLPGAVARHLAVVFLRLAEAGEEPNPAAWQLAWPAWLAYLRSDEAPDSAARAMLLDHLLGLCRRRINDLLARDRFEPARLCWEAVEELPALAKDGPFADDLGGRVQTFRDDLATEYLVTTREAMRFGDIQEGFRADYDRGLSLLRRLLSLDSDNVRLLTAVVETCNDLFLDLYHTQDRAAMRSQIERYTPFALQLGRLIQGNEGMLSVRSALSEFYKARGFVEADGNRKAALYREALAFNPANENVRDLLGELEKRTGEEEEDDDE